MWQAAGCSAQDKLVQMLALASHLTHQQWREQTSPSAGLRALAGKRKGFPALGRKGCLEGPCSTQDGLCVES